MKTRTRFAFVLGAAALGCAVASAAEPGSSTSAAFVPHDGFINSGSAPAPWSATKSLPQDQQPDQEKARAALMMPDPIGVISAGQPASNTSPQQTMGAAPVASNPPPGPIGSTIQTIPAKYSQRNDLLDHLPVMAWPLHLNEQQRQEIYTAVMAQSTQATPDVGALKPAASVSHEQSRELSALPNKIANIDVIRGLKYLKGKNKVLLVQPSTGIVVDQVSM